MQDTTLNLVREWNLSQGTTHPTDLSYQIIRDYHLRRVSVENTSNVRSIGIGIAPYFTCGGDVPPPPIQFVLQPGEIRHIGINPQGSQTQTMYLLNAETGKPVGAPEVLRRDANTAVLRDGVNKWWVQFYRQPSYSAAH